MDYNDIPLFVHVVEAGGFTAAARALGREKSAVSRSIARLEEDLGVRLLQRTTRKLALTEAGRAFYDRVRGAVAGVDDAASAVRELGAEPRGVVRMTASADSHAYGLPGIIARFVEKHPGIHVDLTLTTRAVDLVAEGFDLAIRAGKLADSALIARRVGPTLLHLFGATSYLERRGHPQTLQDLAEHDCVLFRPHAGRSSWTLTGPTGEETVAVRGPIGCDEMGFAAQAVAEGAGIGLLPIEVVRKWVMSREIEVVLKSYRVDGAGIHIVMPSSDFVPSRVALLRDHLVVEIEKVLTTTALACTKAGESYAMSRTSASRTASSASVASTPEIRSGGARRRRERPWAAARRTSGK